jgi:uncharacterized protein (TIGR02246 family)
MRKVSLTVLISVALLLVSPMLGAAQAPAQPQRDAAVHELLAKLADGFARGDMKAVAGLWTADADFLAADGTRIRGRAAIERAFAAMLVAAPKQTVKFDVVEIRRIAKSVALVDAVVRTTPPRSLDRIPSVTFTLVEENGQWRIASAHETIDVVPAPAAHLQDLAWLVGHWQREQSTAGHPMTSVCDWAANHSFLIRKFTSAGKGGRSLAGTEVIGWDPRNNRIRSWSFDSTGGFGENVWLRQGKHWILQHTGTMADGDHVVASYIVTPVDAETITVEPRDHVLNGEPEPDGPTITMKRVAAESPAAKAPVAKPGLPAAPRQ